MHCRIMMIFASIIKIFVRNSMIILKKDWTPITLTLTLSQKNDSIHLLYAIKNSDAWLTDSESFYKELITNASYASTLLFETLYRNRNKGAGVTCGICEKRYDPCNCEQVKFPYSLYDANECKKKNKAFVQDFFANNNQGSNPDRKFLVSDSDEKRIFGSLNKDPDSVMIYNTSRFDISQKGIDLFIKVIKPILLADEHVQFVICIKGISKNRKYDYINDYLKIVKAINCLKEE